MNSTTIIVLILITVTLFSGTNTRLNFDEGELGARASGESSETPSRPVSR